MPTVMTFKRTWRGRQITAALKPAVPEATGAAAELLKANAIPDTPIDQGDLRGAYVTKPADNGATWLIVDSRYAATQHNHPEFVHEKGGKAFYLSDHLREDRSALYGVMAARMRRAVARAS